MDYAAVYADIIRQDLETIKGGVGDFEIIIPVSEIQSVNLFDPNAYLTFNPSAKSEWDCLYQLSWRTSQAL